ncbi:hypothetical protein L218DRAFT_952544 [Marasmius fiardii PR-910]|nr:hypothetical protein L218DRAFT_952544 [Marasmius fiardii PR-910]
MNSITFDSNKFRTRNLRRDTQFFQQLITFPEPPIFLPPALTSDISGTSVSPALYNDIPEPLYRLDHGSAPLQSPENDTVCNTVEFCGARSVEVDTSSSSNSMAAQPLYPPSKRWSWINGHQIVDVEQVFLSDGAMCDVFLKTANVGHRRLKYICKTWPILRNWQGAFYSELALYKKHMRDLQGDVVPSIITVLTGPTTLNVAMEPPHHSFWIEASTDMPLMLKARCVEAFKKIHDRGVLHGDVELRHIFIGGDGKVTIIDFQESRALEAIEAVNLTRATPEELKKEMRKVKCKLDLPGCRELEFGRFQRYLKLSRGICFGEQGLNDWEMEDLRQNPPITDSREWEDWIRTPPAPRRFVMPGQTPDHVFEAIQRFLDIIDSPESDMAPVHAPIESRRDIQPRKLELSLELRPPPQKRSIEDKGSLDLAASPPKRICYHEPELLFSGTKGHPDSTNGTHESCSRKRPWTDAVTQGALPKRIRLDSDSAHSDNSRSPRPFPTVDIAEISIDLPQVHRGIPGHAADHNLIHNVLERRRRRSSPTTETISMHNLAVCALEGLPHPTLVELFPNHPRWKDPDVSAYLSERLRKRQAVINQARACPKKIFFPPSDPESRGNLRRSLTEIRQRIGCLSTIPVIEPLSDVNSEISSPCGRVRFSFGDPVCESETSGHHDTTGFTHTPLLQSHTDILQRSIWWHRPVFGWLGELLNLW